MRTNLIERLNVALILFSLLLAYLLPFRLFLFSYAVLGPLHYLTEINWLDRKNYFVQNKKWIWFFVIVTFTISIPVVLSLPALSAIHDITFIKSISDRIDNSTDILLLAALLFAIGLIHFKNWKTIAVFLVISLILAKLITQYVLVSYRLVGIFLPTLIHVYVFTLLFMIMGTLNTRNKAGIVACVLLLLSPLIVYLLPISTSYYLAVESADAIHTARNFGITRYMTDSFNHTHIGEHLELSVFGIKFQVFIAFCYTYHYLNWFSKTSIIGWNKNVSRAKLYTILVFWVGIILLFFYNYETAYLALFFLAMLHIILEFPLNITSIKEIVLKLKTKGPQ